MKILNLYNCNLKTIEKQLSIVKDQHFDVIKTSVIQPVATTPKQEWWNLYKPLNLTIGNHLGTKEDLIDLCNKAKQNDIDIFVETVINQFNEVNQINPAFKTKSFPVIKDWNNRAEVINGKIYGFCAPDIYNSEFQNEILNFFKDLVNCGIKGIEIHGSKQIALPQEYNLVSSGDILFWKKVKELCNDKNIKVLADLAFADRDLIRSYLQYVNVITNKSSALYQEPRCVTYPENYDSNKNNRTTVHTSDTINQMYEDMQTFYPSTELFARPDDNWKKEKIKIANSKYR